MFLNLIKKLKKKETTEIRTEKPIPKCKLTNRTCIEPDLSNCRYCFTYTRMSHFVFYNDDEKHSWIKYINDEYKKNH